MKYKGLLSYTVRMYVYIVKKSTYWSSMLRICSKKSFRRICITLRAAHVGELNQGMFVTLRAAHLGD